MSNILWFHDLGMDDLAQVGGKNASLGEMVTNLGDLGVRVPGGFATTADAYREFLEQDGLADRIRTAVEAIDLDDVAQLARVGADVRAWIEAQPLPAGPSRSSLRADGAAGSEGARPVRALEGRLPGEGRRLKKMAGSWTTPRCER